MKIAAVISHLEAIAPPSLQESYDNAGLITGDPQTACTGIICCLDATVPVIQEAIAKKANLIVAHHPIIFGGLKKINGKNYVEQAVILAIKHDIAIYAIHTNLDNVIHGVNGKMADLLDLKNRRPLVQRQGSLKKLYFFVPVDYMESVRQAVFEAGAGQIGNYSECSFNTLGEGTFRPEIGAKPFLGEVGKRQEEKEYRVELLFPSHLQSSLITAMKAAHPYEEVAYDVVDLANTHPGQGSGLIGDLQEPVTGTDLMHRLKQVFGLSVIRHSAIPDKPVKKLAICGGAGSFLISKALAAGADAFITADLKYHEFFEANGSLLLCDIGHYESEQYTIDLLIAVLAQKFPTFAVLKTGVRTNPVHYF